MSREIKFRAWHKKYEYMARVADINFNRERINLNAADIGSFDNIELMQYTGLKDKNGVEIYEGDIVKANGYIYKVIYWEEEAKYHLTSDYYDSDCSFGDVGDAFIKGNNGEYKDLEVIGNIYENPELLEVEYESRIN